MNPSILLVFGFLYLTGFSPQVFCSPHSQQENREDSQTGQGRERIGTHVGGYPTVQFTSDEGLRVGLFARIFDYGESGTLPFEDLITMGGAYAEEGTSYLWLNYQQTNWRGFRIASEAFYTSTDTERYYGVGDDTVLDETLEEQDFNFYQFDQFTLRQNLQRNLNPTWRWSIGLQWDHLTSQATQENSLFAQDFGESEVDFTGTTVSIGVIHEKRNSEFIATEGSFLRSQLSHSPHFLNNIKSWTRWSTDARFYYPLLSGRRLWLAFQSRYTVSTPSTPLSQKAFLGSSSTLRGLRQNRFVANHSASLRTGLRSIWGSARVFGFPLKLGTGLFVDGGKVANRFSRFFRGSTEVAYGVSFFGSYFTDDFLGHADLAVSDEDFLLYLGLGHAF